MNKRGEVATVASILFGIYIFGGVLLTAINFDVHKNEGESLKAKVSWTELSKKNGKTIWCKMQCKKNCN